MAHAACHMCSVLNVPSPFTQLTTLICTNNQLATLDAISHLAELKSITTLDLQGNALADPAILDLLQQMPNLRCLYLKGNPVVSAIKNYRKAVVAAIPTLGYLDERPVVEDERRMIDAWWLSW